MKYKSVALLFVIQLLQFPSFSYIKLISFHSEVNTLYASQIHIFHSDFLFQIYQDFSSFLCLCIYSSSIGKIVSHNTARQTAASAQSSNWGLSFQEEGKRPVGNATIEELAQYKPFLLKIPKKRKSISPLTQALKMEILLLFWMH